MKNDPTKTRITVRNNDAYEIVGDFEMVDAEGGKYKQHGKVRLCRCGRSNTKPFCDNTHILTGFQSQISARK